MCKIIVSPCSVWVVLMDDFGLVETCIHVSPGMTSPLHISMGKIRVCIMVSVCEGTIRVSMGNCG